MFVTSKLTRTKVLILFVAAAATYSALSASPFFRPAHASGDESVQSLRGRLHDPADHLQPRRHHLREGRRVPAPARRSRILPPHHLLGPRPQRRRDHHGCATRGLKPGASATFDAHYVVDEFAREGDTCEGATVSSSRTEELNKDDNETV